MNNRLLKIIEERVEKFKRNSCMDNGFYLLSEGEVDGFAEMIAELALSSNPELTQDP